MKQSTSHSERTVPLNHENIQNVVILIQDQLLRDDVTTSAVGSSGEKARTRHQRWRKFIDVDKRKCRAVGRTVARRVSNAVHA